MFFPNGTVFSYVDGNVNEDTYPLPNVSASGVPDQVGLLSSSTAAGIASGYRSFSFWKASDPALDSRHLLFDTFEPKCFTDNKHADLKSKDCFTVGE